LRKTAVSSEIVFVLMLRDELPEDLARSLDSSPSAPILKLAQSANRGKANATTRHVKVDDFIVNKKGKSLLNLSS